MPFVRLHLDGCSAVEGRLVRSTRNYVMSTRKLADCNRAPEGLCDLQDEDDTQFLVAALRGLLARLAGAGGDALTAMTDTAAGDESQEIERWEGGDYLYLEAALPDMAGADIDVSIQDGRAFIRMARC
jgi:hypothetical protein